MSTLFLDVDSQRDFLYPAGALYVPGAEKLVPAIAQLNLHAAAHGIALISTVDAHAEDDIEFATWPRHCVAGTIGQRKAEATLVGGTQAIVGKQTVDVFQAPAVVTAIENARADRFVVYGVVTEICVLYAVRGLLRFGKPVRVVSDAIESLTTQGRESAIAEMRAAGVEFCSVADEILTSR